MRAACQGQRQRARQQPTRQRLLPRQGFCFFSLQIPPFPTHFPDFASFNFFPFLSPFLFVLPSLLSSPRPSLFPPFPSPFFLLSSPFRFLLTFFPSMAPPPSFSSPISPFLLPSFLFLSFPSLSSPPLFSPSLFSSPLLPPFCPFLPSVPFPL